MTEAGIQSMLKGHYFYHKFLSKWVRENMNNIAQRLSNKFPLCVSKVENSHKYHDLSICGQRYRMENYAVLATKATYKRYICKNIKLVTDTKYLSTVLRTVRVALINTSTDWKRFFRNFRNTTITVDGRNPLWIVASPGSSELNTDGLVYLGELLFRFFLPIFGEEIE